MAEASFRSTIGTMKPILAATTTSRRDAVGSTRSSTASRVSHIHAKPAHSVYTGAATTFGRGTQYSQSQPGHAFGVNKIVGDDRTDDADPLVKVIDRYPAQFEANPAASVAPQDETTSLMQQHTGLVETLANDDYHKLQKD